MYRFLKKKCDRRYFLYFMRKTLRSSTLKVVFGRKFQDTGGILGSKEKKTETNWETGIFMPKPIHDRFDFVIIQKQKTKRIRVYNFYFIPMFIP